MSSSMYVCVYNYIHIGHSIHVCVYNHVRKSYTADSPATCVSRIQFWCVWVCVYICGWCVCVCAYLQLMCLRYSFGVGVFLPGVYMCVSFEHVRVCACMRVCVCACVCA